MNIIELLRNFKGYICLEINGGFRERFINLCAVRRITVFDVKYDGPSLRIKVPIKMFPLLRDVASKTGVHIKVTRKCGLPFFIAENADRAGLLAGCIFFVLFVTVMNCFVWCIDAAGSEKYSSEQIANAAFDCGFRYGACRFFLNEGEIARNIYKSFVGELSWVTLNVRGSRASVEVRDTVIPSEKKAEDKEPCNIFADFDGVIMSDETLAGVRCVNKGSAVKKGDLLISGVVENENLSAALYKAKGNFTALHRTAEEFKIEKNHSLNKIEKFSRGYILNLFGLDIPVFKPKSDENSLSFNVEFYPFFKNVRLPFGISLVYSAEYKEDYAGTDESLLIAAEGYSAMCYDKYVNTKILNSDIKIFDNESEIIVSGEYECIDFIGESRPIIIENNES